MSADGFWKFSVFAANRIYTAPFGTKTFLCPVILKINSQTIVLTGLNCTMHGKRPSSPSYPRFPRKKKPIQIVRINYVCIIINYFCVLSILAIPSNVDDYHRFSYAVLCDHLSTGKRTKSSCVLPESHNRKCVDSNKTFYTYLNTNVLLMCSFSTNKIHTYPDRRTIAQIRFYYHRAI